MTKIQISAAKPAIVTRAIWLLSLSLGIIFIASVWLAFINPVSSQSGFFTLLIMAWLTYKINQERNWARITFLVLYLLGTLISIPAFLAPHSSFNFEVFIVQAALQAISLFMLFSRNASPWFRPATIPSTAPEPN
jgi:hypothetical protein